MNAISIINLIINIGFIVLLMLALLVGYLKGFWSKLRNLIGLGVGLIFLFALLGPISKGVASANIPGLDGSVSDFIVGALTDALDGASIQEGSETYMLCNDLARSIIKMVILMLGILSILIITEPLVKLVIKLIWGKDEHEKTVPLRLAGAGLGLAHFLIVALLLTLPFAGLTNLAMSYKEELEKIEDNGNIELVESIERLNNNIPNTLHKIFGKNTSTNLLGNITSVKNDNGRFNFVKEVQNVQPLVSILISEVSENGIDFINVIVNSKEALANFVENTNILDNFMPAILEILDITKALENTGISIEDLKNIDFVQNKKSIASVIRVVGDFIEQTELDLENPGAFLGNDQLPVALETLGEALKDTSFIKPLLSLIQTTLQKALGDVSPELSELFNVLDLNKITQENLASDLKKLGVIVNGAYDLGIFAGEEVNVFDKPEQIKEMMKALFDISIVKGNESRFVELMFKLTGLEEGLTSAGIELNFEGINWTEELILLEDVIDNFSQANKNIEGFDLGNIYSYLTDESQKEHIVPLLKSISRTNIIDFGFVTNILEQELKNAGFDININTDQHINWETEIDTLVDVLPLIDEVEEIMNDYENRVADVARLLKDICASQLLSSLGKGILSSVVEEAGIKVDLTCLDMNKVTSWNNEVSKVINLKNEMLDIASEFSSLTGEQIKDIIIKTTGTEEEPCFIASYITGSLVQIELQKALKEENYQELISKYDLCDPDSLRIAAEDIKTLVDLSKSLEEVTISETLSKADIDKFCEIYASLDKSDTIVQEILVKDVIEKADLDLTSEEISNVSFENESAFLQEILDAMADNLSDEEIEALIKKAEEETTVAIAIINKYFK